MSEINSGLSLSDLDATKASSEAVEFEFTNALGEGTGIFLKVLGGQSEKVTSEVARLINDRRRKEAARAIQRSIGVGKKNVDFETVEDDVAFGQRLAAVRLVGWRGIKEDWTPENALRLCSTNRNAAAQVVMFSDDMENFMSS